MATYLTQLLPISTSTSFREPYDFLHPPDSSFLDYMWLFINDNTDDLSFDWLPESDLIRDAEYGISATATLSQNDCEKYHTAAWLKTQAPRDKQPDLSSSSARDLPRHSIPQY